MEIRTELRENRLQPERERREENNDDTIRRSTANYINDLEERGIYVARKNDLERINAESDWLIFHTSSLRQAEVFAQGYQGFSLDNENLKLIFRHLIEENNESREYFDPATFENNFSILSQVIGTPNG